MFAAGTPLGLDLAEEPEREMMVWISKPLWNARCTRRTSRIGWWTSVIAAAVLAIISVHASAAGLPGPLVNVKWLHGHLNEVTVVAIRGAPAEFTTPPRYGAVATGGKARPVAVGGHIQGARLLALGSILAPQKIDGRDVADMPPTAEAFQDAMRRAGVNGGEKLVISSAGDSAVALDIAARLYWTVKTYGGKDVAILNGGMAAWLEAGYPVSTAAATPAIGDWTATKADWRWFAESAAVADASAGNGVQLVDARPTSEFLGITKSPIVHRLGHIKGARSFPPDAIVRHEGIATYFLSAAEYREILPQLGINESAPTIVYCNTGIYSSGAWFVMHEVLGNPDVRLYVGSMQEWTLEGRPVVP